FINNVVAMGWNDGAGRELVALGAFEELITGEVIAGFAFAQIPPTNVDVRSCRIIELDRILKWKISVGEQLIENDIRNDPNIRLTLGGFGKPDNRGSSV